MEKEKVEKEMSWVLEFPLSLHGRSIGRVCVVGHPNGHTTAQCMDEIITLLEPFETRLAEFADGARKDEIPTLQWPELAAEVGR